MSATSVATSRLNPVSVLSWILQLAAAGMFLFAGTHKLAADPMMVQVFETVGGQWFRYLTGGIELVAGAALLVPAAAPYAALVLATVMVGAIATHLFIIGGSAVPALVLLVVTLAIAWLRRDQLR